MNFDINSLGLLKPKQIEINGQEFVIGKFNAYDGEEIIGKLLIKAIDQLKDFTGFQEVCNKMLSYAAVRTEKGYLRIINKSVGEGHIQDWETKLELQGQLTEYNCSFLPEGTVSNFLKTFRQESHTLIIETLARSSVQS